MKLGRVFVDMLAIGVGVCTTYVGFKAFKNDYGVK